MPGIWESPGITHRGGDSGVYIVKRHFLAYLYINIELDRIELPILLLYISLCGLHYLDLELFLYLLIVSDQ